MLKSAKGRKSKGRRNELKTKQFLEKNGWLVELVKGSTKYNTSVDFFGLFDGLAIKQGLVMFFQVKSNRKCSLKPFKEFQEKYGVPIWLFVWFDYKKEPLIIDVGERC